jgi:phosphoserine phosphatase
MRDGSWSGAWIVAVLAMLAIGGCGADDDWQITAAGARHGASTARPPLRRCEDRFAAAAPARGFRTFTNRLKARAMARHGTQDVVATPGALLQLNSTFAYGPLGFALVSEEVDVFLHDCADWRGIANLETDPWGRISVALPHMAEAGRFTLVHHVPGDATHLRSSVHVLPPGTRFVVIDVDGTLTNKSSDLLRNLFAEMLDDTYVAQARPYAAEMTRAWRAKGYQIIYLTGRPKLLRRMTSQWLERGDFAPGALHFSETRAELVPTVAGVGAYKAAYLESLMDMGYQVDYVYGDFTTDLYAFDRAGVRRDHVFFLGDPSKAGGARVISGDYHAHLGDIAAEPDAVQPFRD